jgi:hypothetical protein
MYFAREILQLKNFTDIEAFFAFFLSRAVA